MPTLHLSQDTDADALLSKDPLALLMGMLLDHHLFDPRNKVWPVARLSSGAPVMPSGPAA
jgi:hypothetical protein